MSLALLVYFYTALTLAILFSSMKTIYAGEGKEFEGWSTVVLASVFFPVILVVAVIMALNVTFKTNKEKDK